MMILCTRLSLTPKNPRFLMALWLWIALIFTSAPNIYAQSKAEGLTHDNKTQALALANIIYTQNLIVDPKLSYANLKYYQKTPEEKLRILRSIAMDALILRNSLDAAKTVRVYEKEVLNQNSQTDKQIVHLYTLYIKLSKLDAGSDDAKTLIDQLEIYQESNNWFIANRAYILNAQRYGGQGQMGTALNLAHAAFSLIPTELNGEQAKDIQEASYETNDIIAYLNALMNNPKLMLEATERVIIQGQALNRSIDGIGHIGNFAYVFKTWRDYETAAKLTKVLIDLTEKNNIEVSGLTSLHYGQSLNNLGKFNQATPFLKQALLDEKNPRLQLNLEIQLAISLAGSGDLPAALASLGRFETLAKASKFNMAGLNKYLLQARALMAVKRNDAASVYELMNTRLDGEMLQTFKRIGSTAQLQLAELENSKQRQLEQASAMQREAELQKKQLDAKQDSLMLLVFLVISLVCIAIGAIVFAAWRQKTNKTLIEAAHVANAGNRAKSQFLAVMSHEFRTPLNGIIGISGLLSEYGETQTLRNQNKIILDSGHSLLETLNGIIDMSQMESGALDIVTAPTDMHQMVGSLIRKFESQLTTSLDGSRPVTLTCHVAKDIPHDLMLDSIRVKQALSNLISNAVKFTTDGRIHVHITVSEQDDKMSPQMLTMIVADTGRGISKKAQVNLFKPFIQADSTLTRTHGGAGVGLTVTRGLARLMGGDVTMCSNIGKGSEFILTVQTCSAEHAVYNPETNRPFFEATVKSDQVVDFAPATSVKALKTQAPSGEDTRLSSNDKTQNPSIREAFKRLKTRASKPISAQDIMPDAVLEAQDMSDLESVDVENEPSIEPSIAVPEQNDFDELELLLAPDDNMEFETVSEIEPEGSGARAQDNTKSETGNDALLEIAKRGNTPDENIVRQSAPQPENPQAEIRRAFTRRAPRENDTKISPDELSGLNILVVEDIETNQIVLRSLLEPVGCHITMAGHGKKAIEMLELQVYDVIIMDIRMPIMNGIEATRHIRQTPSPHQDVPIIALTADASAENNAQCLAVGANVFLTKPVIVSELFSSIRFVREKHTRNQKAELSA